MTKSSLMAMSAVDCGDGRADIVYHSAMTDWDTGGTYNHPTHGEIRRGTIVTYGGDVGVIEALRPAFRMYTTWTDQGDLVVASVRMFRTGSCATAYAHKLEVVDGY